MALTHPFFRSRYLVIWAATTVALPTMLKNRIAMNNHEDDGAQTATKPCDAEDLPCLLCKQMSEMRVVTADELLQGHREMIILHAGQVYRLMRTRNNKLILQK